ncbi:uncharacterized protein LOC143563579 [Bidens hawaiensis]|uniref:uncharacterized protein LOC143563579 n=1 Tax=Bidens hawaiensis TaxID=980011 RepID=UPI0040493B74
MSEWRQEDGYDTLLVYLPGFQKENIKVMIEGVSIVRVRGERLVSENKWSLFHEKYRLPESCEISGISARFDGGILTITMPRKITNAPPPPPPTNMDRVAPKREQPQNPKEEPKEKKPDKPQTTRLEDKTLPPQPKPTSSSAPTKQQPSKPQTTGSEDSTWPTLPKPSSSAPTKQPSKPQTSYTLPPQPKATSSSAPNKQTPNTHLADKTLPPQPKPTSSSAPTKQQLPTTRLEDKIAPPQPKPAFSSTPTKQQPSNIRLEDNTLPPQPKSTSSTTPTKQQPSGPTPKAKEARGGFKQDVAEKPDVRKKMDLDKGKGKEAILKEETKRDFEGSKGKPNNSGVISGGLQGILARRGLVNEDRKLLVNVGVGVLMIAALAIHVSYTIGLIGKEK